ncbi:MAG TPA: hypothetical protein DEA08_26215, partial [Planctomycetes bacterium]|nr:hypothetical protein [Planctomycetota bacterium]
MSATLPIAGEVLDRTFTPEVHEELDRLIARYPEKKAALLPALRVAEREFGSCDLGAMKAVAEKLELAPAYVMGVVSFYFHFRRPTDGTFVIEVCRTLPCALRGADDFAKHASEKLGIGFGETTPDGLFTLKNAECLAACDKAPVCHVNAYAWELLDNDTFDQLVDDLRKDPEGFDLTAGRKTPNPWKGPADPNAKRTKPEGERDYEYEALTHEPILA